MSNETRKPIKSLRDKFLHASIWENEGSKGLFYNFTVSRSYKAGEDVKYASNFGADDALALGRLIDQVYGEIRELETAAFHAANDNAAPVPAAEPTVAIG